MLFFRKDVWQECVVDLRARTSLGPLLRQTTRGPPSLFQVAQPLFLFRSRRPLFLRHSFYHAQNLPLFSLPKIFREPIGRLPLALSVFLLNMLSALTHPFTESFGQRRCAITWQQKKVTPHRLLLVLSRYTSDPLFFYLRDYLCWDGVVERTEANADAWRKSEDQGRARVWSLREQLVGTAHRDDRSKSFLQPRRRRLFSLAQNTTESTVLR